LLKYSIFRILPEPVFSHIAMYAIYGLFCDILLFFFIGERKKRKASLVEVY
jgi:hypothetical protein